MPEDVSRLTKTLAEGDAPLSDASSRQAASAAQSKTPEQLPLPKAKWRPGCLSLFASFLFVICLACWGGYALWKHQLANELEDKIAAIRERGEPVWFSDLEPEPLPTNENGAAEFLRAGQMQEDLWRRAYQYQGEFAATQTYIENQKSYGDLENLTQTQRDEIAAMLTENQKILDLARQAIDRSAIQFEYDYKDPTPWDILLPHIDFAYKFTEMLRAESAIARFDGDLDQAARSVLDIFRLTYALRTEFLAVPSYSRRRLNGKAIETLRQVLALGPINKETLHELDDSLRRLEKTIRGHDVVLGERALSLTSCMNATAKMFSEIADMSSYEFETGNWNEQAFLKLEPFRTREAIMLLDAVDGFAELVDQPGEEENEKIVALAAKHDDRIPGDSVLDEYGLVPGFSGFRESLLTHRQQLINMRLALRLARRYRETGTLPASLEDIVDDSLPQIQLGLLSQRPLVYRVFADAAGPGFEIYDVGLDGVDNGGTMEGGDWAELDSRVSIRFK